MSYRGANSNYRSGFRGGSYRGRARGYGQNNAQSASAYNLPPDRDIYEGLKRVETRTISLPKLKKEAVDVDIKSVRYLGSYNWVKRNESDTPTIIVPGSPAPWNSNKEAQLPFSVTADTGVQFKDQNGYHMPKAGLQPLFTAADECTPEFEWKDVDFVTDRNGLCKLLRWISFALGTNPEKEAREFRVDLELAGEKTVLMNRWENRNREVMPGYTFGFNFEKAITNETPGCENSTGHHRVVTYDMDGLKMVVRYEVDAYFPPKNSNGNASTKTSSATIDDLITGLSGVSLSSSSTDTLKVIRGGKEVPQDSIIEMSTISTKRIHLYDWEECYGQLFLSQTPNHALAEHERGRFLSIYHKRIDTQGGKLAQLAQNMSQEINHLRMALKMIQEALVENAKGNGGKNLKLSLVFRNGDLKLHERESQERCLPSILFERF